MDLSSNAILQQEKGDDEVVKWKELASLREALSQKIDKVNEVMKGELSDLSEHIAGEIQHVDTAIASFLNLLKFSNTKSLLYKGRLLQLHNNWLP